MKNWCYLACSSLPVAYLGRIVFVSNGLSLVAKLAPKRFASLLMGVWFIGNAAGYALAGTLGAITPTEITTPMQQKWNNLQAFLIKLPRLHHNN